MDYLIASPSDFEFESREEVRYHQQFFEKYYKMVTQERDTAIMEKGADFVVTPTEIVLFINTWPYCSGPWELEYNGWQRYRAIRAAESAARDHKNIVAIFVDRKGLKPEGYITSMMVAAELQTSAKRNGVEFHADTYTNGDGRCLRRDLHEMQLTKRETDGQGKDSDPMADE